MCQKPQRPGKQALCGTQAFSFSFGHTRKCSGLAPGGVQRDHLRHKCFACLRIALRPPRGPGHTGSIFIQMIPLDPHGHHSKCCHCPLPFPFISLSVGLPDVLNFIFVVWFLFWGHSLQCSGVTPDSELRNLPGGAQGSYGLPGIKPGSPVQDKCLSCYAIVPVHKIP